MKQKGGGGFTAHGSHFIISHFEKKLDTSQRNILCVNRGRYQAALPVTFKTKKYAKRCWQVSVDETQKNHWLHQEFSGFFNQLRQKRSSSRIVNKEMLRNLKLLKKNILSLITLYLALHISTGSRVLSWNSGFWRNVVENFMIRVNNYEHKQLAKPFEPFQQLSSLEVQ